MTKNQYFISLFVLTILLSSAYAQVNSPYPSTPFISLLDSEDHTSLIESATSEYPSTIMDEDCHVNPEVRIRNNSIGAQNFTSIKNKIYEALLDKGYIFDTDSDKRISVSSFGYEECDRMHIGGLTPRCVGSAYARLYMLNFPEQIVPYYKEFTRKRLVVDYVPERVLNRLTRRAIRVIPRCIVKDN